MWNYSNYIGVVLPVANQCHGILNTSMLAAAARRLGLNLDQAKSSPYPIYKKYFDYLAWGHRFKKNPVKTYAPASSLDGAATALLVANSSWMRAFFFKTNSFTDCCIWNVATRHCPFIPEVCILLSLHSKFFEPQHITEFVWPRRCYHFFWDTQEHVIEVKRVKTLNAQCSHVLISSNLLSVGLGHDGYQGLGFLSQTVSYLRTPSHNDFHIPLH